MLNTSWFPSQASRNLTQETRRSEFSTQQRPKNNGVTKKIIGKIEPKDHYLDCKSAQKIPLFLPIVCSSEFIVRQFPCAVQSTAAAIPMKTEAV